MTAPRKLDVTKMAAEIMAGRHDGDLQAITDAIRHRVKDGATSFRWKITLGDDEWTEETLTLGEVGWVERITGKTWLDVGRPGETGAVTAAYVVAHYISVGGMEYDAAREKVAGLNAGDVALAVSEYEVPKPAPKDPAPSTSS